MSRVRPQIHSLIRQKEFLCLGSGLLVVCRIKGWCDAIFSRQLRAIFNPTGDRATKKRIPHVVELREGCSQGSDAAVVWLPRRSSAMHTAMHQRRTPLVQENSRKHLERVALPLPRESSVPSPCPRPWGIYDGRGRGANTPRGPNLRQFRYSASRFYATLIQDGNVGLFRSFSSEGFDVRSLHERPTFSGKNPPII